MQVVVLTSLTRSTAESNFGVKHINLGGILYRLFYYIFKYLLNSNSVYYLLKTGGFMKINPKALTLYAITDRQWLNNMTLAKAVEQSIKGGATFIQLREKNISDEELLKLALEVKSVTDKYSIPFVINDNVYLAKEINADGVHVGADDMTVAQARRILGESKIIGGTARTLERALIAFNEGADYLGIGAVFNTATKSGTTHMTKTLAQSINNSVDIPTVAIGGINKDNITKLSGYGISGVAVVSSVFNSDNIEKSAAELKTLAEKIFCY